jgi:tape measure domain-containing protein
MQQNQISFETMLGSASQAKQFMAWAQKFAASTPFEMNDVVTGSKRLLAFGFSAQQIPKMLTAIGDASSAMGMSGQEGIGRIANALGQMAAHGTVDAQDMLQLTSIGIPAWDILAQAMGKSTSEVMKMSSKGLIPAKTAINQLVDGMEQRFPGMMDKQSRSYQGLMSTLKDNVVSTLGNIIKPKFEEFSNVVLPMLINVTKAVSDTFGKTHSVIQALGAGIGKAFGPGAQQVFEGLATGVKNVFGWLIEHHAGVQAALVGIASGFAALSTINKITGT